MDKPISLHLCQGQLNSPYSAPEAFLVLQDSEVWVTDRCSCDQWKDQTWTCPELIQQPPQMEHSGFQGIPSILRKIRGRGGEEEINNLKSSLKSMPVFRLRWDELE